MLWPPPTYGLYATTTVCDGSASNWFDLSQLSLPELVRSTYTEVHA